MSVTQAEFDAAQQQLVTDTDIIHQFTTADDTTTIPVGDGSTSVPSLKKVISDTVGTLDNLTPKDGTGANGTWSIDITGKAGSVDAITQAQVEAAMGGAIVLAAEKGAVNGVCDLDASGLVPSNRLPSYVDDVIEVATKADLPATGVSGKIYLVDADESRSGTTTQYRWSGSTYTRIVSSPGSTDEVPEGVTNKYFTEDRVRATLMTGLAIINGQDVGVADSLMQAIGKMIGNINNALNFAKTYDFHSFVAGKPAASATVLFVKAGRAFNIPANLAGAQAKAKTAATAASTVTLYKNGSSFATISFAAGASTATLSGTATSFAIGDELTVVAPATQDSTLADIALTLLATQN